MKNKTLIPVSLLQAIIDLLIHLDVSRLDPELQYEFEWVVCNLSRKHSHLLRAAFLDKARSETLRLYDAASFAPLDDHSLPLDLDGPPF